MLGRRTKVTTLRSLSLVARTCLTLSSEHSVTCNAEGHWHKLT